VDDPSLTVAFSLVDESDTSLLIWTTTPWTLVSNLAVMAGPSIDYVKVRRRSTGKHYYLARARLSSYDKEGLEYEIIADLKGTALEGKRYRPPFPYFEERSDAFRVILDDQVSTEEGTGLVHAAPAFGEADFYACQRAGIDLVCPVDSNGRFTAEIPEYAGDFVKDADKDIIKRLKTQGQVIQAGTLHHRYPFCWRSDTPLIYKAVRTWFVAVEKLKPALLQANEQIHWTPENIKYGRFGKWLEGARDWAISRNRYWGTPIPIWRAEDGELFVAGSIKELEEVTGEKLTDLHRHFIDQLVVTIKGKQFHRIPEVFDCWFESGSMPYAQNHYPFENRSLFEQGFPADFIGEGLDQTRGWFYTLTILSTALFNGPAFRNVVVNGIVLAQDGSKMSKRLRNYPDPGVVIGKYGADAIRLYMMHSPAVKADDLCFSEHGVELVLRQILLPLWNACSFLATYAAIYQWEPKQETLKPEAEIDRWMLSLLDRLIKEVEEGMNGYNLNRSVEPFVAFVDQLTNWYIRRSRRRFWEEEETQDRREAFATLYHVLVELSKVAAPFIPFISEALYQNLRAPGMPDSVHLCAFPSPQSERRDLQLEAAMEAVQRCVSLGHSLRKEQKLKVRQPLPAAHIAAGEMQLLDLLRTHQQLIAEELNVKEVTFSASEEQFVQLKAKPNFRVLGKKVGKMLPLVQKRIEQFTREEMQHFMQGSPIPIELEGAAFELTSEDLQIERQVREGMIAANYDRITIALDTHLTEELLIEGLARELINKINTMRRDAGFAVTDRVHIKLQTSERVRTSFEKFRALITNDVLAVSVSFTPCQGTQWDLNGEPTVIALEKA